MSEKLAEEFRLTEKELLNFIDEAINSYIVSEQLTEIVKEHFNTILRVPKKRKKLTIRKK